MSTATNAINDANLTAGANTFSTMSATNNATEETVAAGNKTLQQSMLNFQSENIGNNMTALSMQRNQAKLDTQAKGIENMNKTLGKLLQ